MISWIPPHSKSKLSIDDVHIWCTSLLQSGRCFRLLQRIISDDERQRVEGMRFERDRRRLIIGRGLLRMITSYYLGEEPSKLQFQYGHHGKPYLRDSSGNKSLHFNLAHSNEMALYAFTRSIEMGIDIEYIRDLPDAEQIARSTFSPLENMMLHDLPAHQKQEAFFNCWVRKEAFIKAIGDGLYHSLDRFDVTLSPGEPAQLLRIDGDTEKASRWFIKSLAPARGYAAAIAVENHHLHYSYWQVPEDSDWFS